MDASAARVSQAALGIAKLRWRGSTRFGVRVAGRTEEMLAEAGHQFQ
jgi:hypothetical protein